MHALFAVAALLAAAPEESEERLIPFEPGVKKGSATAKKPSQPPAVASFTGCLAQQFWDVQSIDGFTSMIRLSNQNGFFQFSFTPQRAEIPDPAIGTPLTTRADAEKYSIILRTIEAAGVARRPLTIDYEPANRRVFGVKVEWGGALCP
jgi:hypothetical protein